MWPSHTHTRPTSTHRAIELNAISRALSWTGCRNDSLPKTVGGQATHTTYPGLPTAPHGRRANSGTLAKLLGDACAVLE